MSLKKALVAASALLLSQAGCRTSDSVLMAGESVSSCEGAGDGDVNGFALLTTVSDFTAEAALETARNNIFEKYAVPEALQAKLPVEIASKCGNKDDNTMTIKAGVSLARYTQSLDGITTLIDGALKPGQLSPSERFKRLMVINKKVATYNANQRFLAKQGVKVAQIPNSGAIQKFYQLRDQMKIGLKFSEKAFVLEDGNVTRNIFKKAFVDMGLHTTDIEKLEGTPDIFFAVDIRWEDLTPGGNSGQQFVRIYATVAMEDGRSATIAATTLEAKGGGVDEKAASTSALRKLEALIVSQLLDSLIPEESL